MTTDHPHYAAAEAAIGAVINGALSLVFCLFVFGGQASVPVGGAHGLIVDAVPQTFMVSLMSLLVPTLLTKVRRHRAGHAPDTKPRHGVTSHPIVRALGGAVLATIVVVLLQVWLLPLGRPAWPFATVLVAKMLYGAVIGGCLSFIAVRLALAASA